MGPRDRRGDLVSLGPRPVGRPYARDDLRGTAGCGASAGPRAGRPGLAANGRAADRGPPAVPLGHRGQADLPGAAHYGPGPSARGRGVPHQPRAPGRAALRRPVPQLPGRRRAAHRRRLLRRRQRRPVRPAGLPARRHHRQPVLADRPPGRRRCRSGRPAPGGQQPPAAEPGRAAAAAGRHVRCVGPGQHPPLRGGRDSILRRGHRGHLCPQGGRGPAGRPRAARPADRAAEPAAAAGPDGAGPGTLPPQRAGHRGALPGSGPRQAGQRRSRPPGRRRAARDDREEPAVCGARDRHGGPARRRRVRRGLRAGRWDGRAGGHGRPDAGGGPDPGRGGLGVCRGDGEHRTGCADLCAGPAPGPAAGRRRCDVPGQAGGPGAGGDRDSAGGPRQRPAAPAGVRGPPGHRPG